MLFALKYKINIFIIVMYFLSYKSKSLNNIQSLNIKPLNNVQSLNNIQSLNKTDFTTEPPLSYGQVVSSKEFTTKKLRCFLIKRYYNFLL
tara:strand:+ start:259 stop:528 length:270 start_codon:yes stop_codon:yes gene_type:complete